MLLLCIRDVISRLPEEIRHKLDDLALGDLIVLKIADKLEIYKNCHLKASAKLQIKVAKEEDSSLDEEELFAETVANKKKWANKKNGFWKINPNCSGNQKSQNQSGNPGASKKGPFCRYCHSQNGDPYYPRADKNASKVSKKMST